MNVARLKLAIEELIDFPDIPSIKSLKNHSLADYRMRVEITECCLMSIGNSARYVF